MPKSSDLSRTPDYYAARAVEERRLAMAARDGKVRQIHLDLAAKYAELSAMGADEPQQAIEETRQVG